MALDVHLLPVTSSKKKHKEASISGGAIKKTEFAFFWDKTAIARWKARPTRRRKSGWHWKNYDRGKKTSVSVYLSVFPLSSRNEMPSTGICFSLGVGPSFPKIFDRINAL